MSRTTQKPGLPAYVPQNLRLTIAAPKASERARLLALLAAESVLASAGATLPECYCELHPEAGLVTSDPRIADALERAGKAARQTLKQLGQPAPRGACLVLLATY